MDFPGEISRGGLFSGRDFPAGIFRDFPGFSGGKSREKTAPKTDRIPGQKTAPKTDRIFRKIPVFWPDFALKKPLKVGKNPVFDRFFRSYYLLGVNPAESGKIRQNPGFSGIFPGFSGIFRAGKIRENPPKSGIFPDFPGFPGSGKIPENRDFPGFSGIFPGFSGREIQISRSENPGIFRTEKSRDFSGQEISDFPHCIFSYIL